MKGLDDYIEGRFDPNNPANWQDETERTPVGLQECMQYAKDTGDFDALEEAICKNEVKLARIKKDLREVTKVLRDKGYDATANFLANLMEYVRRTEIN